MRWSSTLLIAAMLAGLLPVAWGQAVATRGAATHSSAHRSATTPHARKAAQSAGRPGRHAARGAAPKSRAGGVLALDATDITGNKELPKVMVIVPWKHASGADEVIKPTDSLLDEVLQPLDRGVFQRRIRYYGQLRPRKTTPVGDRR